MSVGEKGSSLRNEIRRALTPRNKQQKNISGLEKDARRVFTLVEIPKTVVFKIGAQVFEYMVSCISYTHL